MYSSLKQKMVAEFTQQIDQLDLSMDNAMLSLKYNTIVENIFEMVKIEKEKLSIPLAKTTSNNDFGFDNYLGAGKSKETLLGSNIPHPNYDLLTKNTQEQNRNSVATTIPSNFRLTYEMKQYAQSKHIDDVDDLFEDFVLFYRSKGVVNSDWEATWQRWVKSNGSYKKNHLVKTTIDENMPLTKEYIDVAKKYIPNEKIESEFQKFKNFYISNGDLKVDSQWIKVWENWAMNHKQFQPKELSKKQKQKADYRWDFRKAKDTSDKIKEWLEYDVKLDWKEKYYWNDIKQFEIKTNNGSLKLAWEVMIHPDFNKEEILLFRVDSNDAKYILNSNDEIIDAEVINND